MRHLHREDKSIRTGRTGGRGLSWVHRYAEGWQRRVRGEGRDLREILHYKTSK